MEYQTESGEVMTTLNEELIARLRDRATFLGPELTLAILPEAADLLQSQAERIVELEKLLQNGSEIIAGLFARAANMEAERDTLRAEIAAIAATEPDSYLVEGWHKGELWAKHHNFTLEEAKNSASVFTQHYTTVHTIPLFTRPMPAQGANAELVEAFGKLYKKYVNLLESGRDRILDLGGSCDPVDVMEMSDPELRDARTELSKYNGAN